MGHLFVAYDNGEGEGEGEGNSVNPDIAKPNRFSTFAVPRPNRTMKGCNVLNTSLGGPSGPVSSLPNPALLLEDGPPWIPPAKRSGFLGHD